MKKWMIAVAIASLAIGQTALAQPGPYGNQDRGDQRGEHRGNNGGHADWGHGRGGDWRDGYDRRYRHDGGGYRDHHRRVVCHWRYHRRICERF